MAVVLAAGLGLAVGPAPAQAQVDVYVDVSAGGANDGTSWTDAYTSLQEGLSAATSGDVIWVAAGTYYPDEGPSVTADARGEAFSLKDGVKVFGGFSGSESSLSGRDLSSGETVLSGEIQQDGDASNNAYHVVEAGSGLTSTAALDGITITKGTASGPGPKGCGGGLLLEGGTPRLQNLTLRGNEARQGGGLCLAGGAAPEAANVSVTDNTAEYGGGIYAAESSSGTFTQVTIAGNEATGEGGGVYASGSNPILENAVVWGNATAGTEPSIKNASPTSKSLSLSVTVVGNDLYSGGSYAGSGVEPEDGALGQVTVMAGPATYTFDTSSGSASQTVTVPAGTDSVYFEQSDGDFIDTWVLNNTDTESAPDLRQGTSNFSTFPDLPDYQSNYDGTYAGSRSEDASAADYNLLAVPAGAVVSSYEARVIPAQSPRPAESRVEGSRDTGWETSDGTIAEWQLHVSGQGGRFKERQKNGSTSTSVDLRIEEGGSTYEQNATNAYDTLRDVLPYPTEPPEMKPSIDRDAVGFNVSWTEDVSKGNDSVYDSGFLKKSNAFFGSNLGTALSETYSALTGGFETVADQEPNDTIFDNTGSLIKDKAAFPIRIVYSIYPQANIR